MRKVLYILGQLSDEDAEWLVHNGQQRRVDTGETLITQGRPITALFIVLDGRMRVDIERLGDMGTLGAGEMLGEISFVNQSPPTASVTAVDPTRVLEIPRSALESKLAADQGFASRFYRALSVFLADRLQNTVLRMGYGPHQSNLESDTLQENELDDTLLDGLSQAGERFQRMLHMLSEPR
ncbi:MAG: cyclic nucleotide-binding domain-containing protein [Magnetococcales bacterium]|nr:cyclic nucleotide-binding domain-containing protein [Magnetococcales bacterium]